MKEQQQILFLGENGFPVGFAAIQRQLLMAKGLAENGYNVTVVSAKGNHTKEVDVPKEGVYQGIRYVYMSDSIHRPDSFITRNFKKITGKLKELNYIYQVHKTGTLTACIVSKRDLGLLILYWFWLKILNIPLLLNYCELNSSIETRTGFINKIHDTIFEWVVPRICTQVLPISTYLDQTLKRTYPAVNTLKVPILSDFDRFNKSVIRDEVIRILYCGSPLYNSVIQFVLEAIDLVDVNKKKVEFVFVLGGKPSLFPIIEQRLRESRYAGHIKLLKNIPDTEIPKIYASSTALLIPLRPTIQDKARFPHKIGEAMASGCAIITTNYGEIKEFDFEDGQTALIANQYDIKQFAEKIQFAINHTDKMNKIGQAGYQLAQKKFRPSIYGVQIMNFLNIEEKSKVSLQFDKVNP